MRLHILFVLLLSVILSLLCFADDTPTGGITGRVVDEYGKAIPNATIAIAGLAMFNEITAMTDENGYYKVNNLPAGEYDFRDYIIKLISPTDKFSKLTKDITVKAGETTKAPDIVAGSGAVLSGRLFDAETGKPIVGGKIDIFDESRRTYPSITVDKNGTFRTMVQPGVVSPIYYSGNPFYRGESYSGFRASDVRAINVPKTGLTGVEIKVAKSDVARGRILDQNGKPAVGASITAYPTYIGWFKTDSKGHFKIAIPRENRRAPTSEVMLNVIGADGQTHVILAVDRTTLLAGNAAVKLRPLTTLKVHVTDRSGKPLEGAGVTISEDTNDWSRSHDSRITTTTNSAGIAEFNGLCAGMPYYVRAEKEGYWLGYDYDDPKPGLDNWKDTVKVVMDDLTREFKGRVVDWRNKPVARAEIEVYYGPKYPKVLTDENGEFSLNNLPHSTVWLAASDGERRGHVQAKPDRTYAIIMVY